VGTHALIQEAITFSSLGVVVVDEQHRFGVDQRAWLRDKGRDDGRTPDVLVMTATPIPRTAAMTVYGDLDVSVLDELPPGRTPIVTERVNFDDDHAMWDDICSQLDAGRQVFVVCPLIDESEKMEAASAEETYERLGFGELRDRPIGLLHGRLPPAEKESTMEAFRRGELQALVATTVIEVGVDVPNATVMVILSAERFGIAQLHQLRGRVGRGAHASRCYLVSGDELTADGEARLDALVASTDGFELAEIDLDLRGEGTIFDQRQSGRNDLKLASLRRDRQWVARARRAAAEVVNAGVGHYPGLADELAWFTDDGGDTEYLLKG
jgi:ATP-dependent DNA helicase RecG